MALTREEHERRRMQRLRANPEKYAAYLARKRREAKARGTLNAAYEAQRKAAWRAKNPARAKLLRAAHHAVERAVLSGKLTKPTACADCKMEVELEAHHHKGYEKENWLEVVWLCSICHGAADSRQKAAR